MNQEEKKKMHVKKSRWIRLGIPVLIVILSLLFSRIIARKKVRIRKKPPKKMSLLVETVHLKPVTENVLISAMGKVIAARQVDLYPQVSGMIKKISEDFLQGSVLSEKSVLITIDPSDYEIQLKADHAKLLKAEAFLSLEKGKQSVAKQEWTIMQKRNHLNNTKIDDSLILRKPQMNLALADIKSAKASLEKAKLNLLRCEIKMPFQGVILNKFVDKGSQVSPQTRLASIIYSNELWVEVLIPVEKLKWIQIKNFNSEKGSSVKIMHSPDLNVFMKGEVKMLLKDIESKGRLAKINVSVKNPFKTEKGKIPLLLNSYVTVKIEGKTIQNVFKINRASLREKQVVWTVDSNNRFLIVPVEIIWKDEHTVYFKAKSSALELITTDLSLPVNGIPVERFGVLKKTKNIN